MKHATRRGILVPLYFFVGGLAGGLYLLGALEQLLFRQPENGWPMAWLGFRLALPLEILGAVILTVDLTRPGRFWRLLARFNARSAVSWGTWTLVAFGAAALAAHPWFLEHVPALGQGRGFALWDPLDASTPLPAGSVRGYVAQVLPRDWVHGVGGIAALSLCAYTGILLTASGRRAWNASPWLGGVFLCLALQSALAVGLIVFARVRPGVLFALASATALPAAPPAWQYATLREIPAVLACTGALVLGLLALHLRKVPREPGTGGHRLLSGRLGLGLRAGLLGCGLLPQLLWMHHHVPLQWVPPIAALALAGNLCLRYSLFLCEEG